MPYFKFFFSLKNLPSQRKIFLVGIFLVLFLGVIFGKIYLSQPKPPTPPPAVVKPRRQPSPTPFKATAKLTLQPAKKTLKIGEVLPVSVSLSGEPVQAVDILLRYDPKVFTAWGLKKGALFSQISQEKIKPGEIIFSASVDPANPIPKGNGQVFFFNLTASSANPTTKVEFDRLKTILARNGKNLLGEVVSGSFEIKKP